LFSKFKCEALYVCLLTTERTPTLNIECGQINPKAGGGCNIDSGQNDPKATQGLKGTFHQVKFLVCATYLPNKLF